MNLINSGGENMCMVDKICTLIDFLADNIFVKFGDINKQSLNLHSN